MTSKETVVCSKCKSDKILTLAWVNKNEKTFVKWKEGEISHFCAKCNKVTNVSIVVSEKPTILAWRII